MYDLLIVIVAYLSWLGEKKKKKLPKTNVVFDIYG